MKKFKFLVVASAAALAFSSAAFAAPPAAGAGKDARTQKTEAFETDEPLEFASSQEGNDIIAIAAALLRLSN